MNHEKRMLMGALTNAYSVSQKHSPSFPQQTVKAYSDHSGSQSEKPLTSHVAKSSSINVCVWQIWKCSPPSKNHRVLGLWKNSKPSRRILGPLWIILACFLMPRPRGKVTYIFFFFPVLSGLHIQGNMVLSCHFWFCWFPSSFLYLLEVNLCPGGLVLYSVAWGPNF